MNSWRKPDPSDLANWAWYWIWVENRGDWDFPRLAVWRGTHGYFEDSKTDRQYSVSGVDLVMPVRPPPRPSTSDQVETAERLTADHRRVLDLLERLRASSKEMDE